MNAQRRKTLADIKVRLELILEELETVTQDEQDAYDNMPEGFQMGERGEKAQSVIDNLESLRDDLQSATDQFDDIEE